jgi:hypothetical protein
MKRKLKNDVTRDERQLALTLIAALVLEPEKRPPTPERGPDLNGSATVRAARIAGLFEVRRTA